MRHEENRRSVNEILNDIHQSISSDDQAKFVQLHNELVDSIKEELSAEQKALFDQHMANADREILAKRGENSLTSEERQYFTALGEAMTSKNARQAIENLEYAMPVTVIDRVMEDLRTRHPLLSRINFVPSGPVTRWIFNSNGVQEAAWGELCDEIVTELTAGFKVVETGLFKLSAFLPVCKQGLILGPAYLDSLVRGTLYEALAVGLEKAVVNGTGKKQPIGMTRQVGPDAAVVNGVYPQKNKVAVSDFALETVGSLIGYISADENGKPREIRDLLIVCNQADYYAKVLPATMIMAPDGTYRSALPYNISVVPVSRGLSAGEAIFGLGYRYAAFAGSSTEGNIEYSDHARFLLDQRVYIIKAFANGFPMDDNAFLFLDISGLQSARYKVEAVLPDDPSDDATLAKLFIGDLELDSAFDPDDTSYSASTTDEKNIVFAVPSDVDAEIAITVGDTPVENGDYATWAAGSNTLTIAVTAPDGEATKSYTVTVTKS